MNIIDDSFVQEKKTLNIPPFVYDKNINFIIMKFNQENIRSWAFIFEVHFSQGYFHQLEKNNRLITRNRLIDVYSNIYSLLWKCLMIFQIIIATTININWNSSSNWPWILFNVKQNEYIKLSTELLNLYNDFFKGYSI